MYVTELEYRDKIVDGPPPLVTELVANSVEKYDLIIRGIYILLGDSYHQQRVCGNSVLYIGRSVNILARLTSHSNKPWNRVVIIRTGDITVKELSTLETRLIHIYKPRHNRQTASPSARRWGSCHDGYNMHLNPIKGGY